MSLSVLMKAKSVMAVKLLIVTTNCSDNQLTTLPHSQDHGVVLGPQPFWDPLTTSSSEIKQMVNHDRKCVAVNIFFGKMANTVLCNTYTLAHYVSSYAWLFFPKEGPPYFAILWALHACITLYNITMTTSMPLQIWLPEMWSPIWATRGSSDTTIKTTIISSNFPES